MQIDKQTGLIPAIKYHPSPNQDERPDSENIIGIVVHNISLPSGDLGGLD